MTRFAIYNMNAGEDLGTYDAEGADSALDVMAQAYGFKDYADCIRDYGLTVEEAKAELQITAEG